MVFAPGMRLTDRYRLVTQIGLGGMSEVWRAVDELLSRPVAVKALASPLAVDPALRAATWREARAAARLAHPHVTQVYDYGEANISGDAPVPYLVMELVEGQNLADRLAAGPLPWASAARVSAQVAAALAAAHTLGVVHRDIKPGNVMLTPNGAKVLDFGIAALTGARPEHDGGLLIGTPAYAAPERLGHGATDPAGDVYSLGALFYECLTERTPLAVTTWEQAAAAHERAASPAPLTVPGLPPDLAALCLACLSRDPAERPGADQVTARLTAVVGGVNLASPALDPPATLAAHPPTLIDRSLAGTAPADPPATGLPSTPGWAAAPSRSGTVPPQAAMAGGAAAAARISASASVVHRNPAPAPGPEFDGPDPGSGPPRRSRLALVGVAGGIAAAGLALALVASALIPHSGPDRAAQNPSATAPADAPSTDQTGSPTARARPTTAEGIVEEFDLILTEAVDAGQVDEDVAEDLRGKLEDVQKQLGEGKRKNLREKVADLLDEIRHKSEAGDLPAAIAEQLQSLLQPLRNSGRDNGGGDG